MDINFDWNFWSILFATLGYAIGAFTKRVGKANEIDQIIRDAAQIQATNRDLEMQNDKLNQTLFESTKENQRIINENAKLCEMLVERSNQIEKMQNRAVRKPVYDFDNDNDLNSMGF